MLRSVVFVAVLACSLPAIGQPLELPRPETTPTPQPTVRASLDRTAFRNLQAAESYWWTPQNSLAQSRPVSPRLARSAPMFGNFYGGTTVFDNCELPPPTGDPHVTPFPSGSIAGALNVADNNHTLPIDRVYFLFNQFRNALGNNVVGVNAQNINRYTVGIEKTFQNGLSSIEIRMPFTEGFNITSLDGSSAQGGGVGNFSIILKRLLYESEDTAIGAGIAIETPTGSNSSGLLDNTPIRLDNRSVHLHPWLGIATAPADDCFFQLFISVDGPLNGQFVEAGTPGAGSSITAGGSGDWRPPVLFHADLQFGVWLLGGGNAGSGFNLAGIFEFHYATTVGDPDRVLIGGGMFHDPGGNRDITDATIGLHLNINDRLDIRYATSFPLADCFDKTFSLEHQFVIIGYY